MHDILVVFAIIIFISILFKLLYKNTETVLEGINAVVFNVMLPALCIRTFANLSITISTAISFITLPVIANILELAKKK